MGDDASRANTLARWAQTPDYINNDMLNNKKGLATGYALARPVVESVIGQMQQSLATPIEDNMYYMPAMRDQTSEFQKEMQLQVEQNIMPVIQTYLTFMQQEYLQQVQPKLSISTLPDGPQCYTAMLNANTTLTNNAAEIFAWGEEAISERKAMVRLLGKQLYGSDDLAVIKQTFNNDPNNFFKTKVELLAAAQAAIDRAKVQSREYFNLFPKADVILESLSEIEAKTGNSRYLPTSDDGSQPATYIQTTYPPEKKS